VTRQREFLFGEIVNKEMMLSRYGKIVQKWWGEIPMHFPNVETDAFIIMPNHIHGIIFILESGDTEFEVGRGTVPVPEDDGVKIIPNNKDISSQNDMGGETPPLQVPTLGQIVAYFKYQSTKEMNRVENTGTITKFWQRNYYEHVIRNETDLQNKTNYIEANPLLWGEDDENPVSLKR
jgi:putative transposase